MDPKGEFDGNSGDGYYQNIFYAFNAFMYFSKNEFKNYFRPTKKKTMPGDGN